MLGPAHGFRVAGLQDVKRKRLPIIREVSLDEAPQLVPIEPRRLLLEVQERPELEAGVRDCELDSMTAGLLPGIVQPSVVVHVEHAPDFVITQKVIAPAAGLPFSVLHHRECALHQSLRVFPESFDHDLDQGIAELRPQSLEITGLGLSTPRRGPRCAVSAPGEGLGAPDPARYSGFSSAFSG
jgi:hypothetical protein